MRITLLCDNPNSWMIPYMEGLGSELFQKGHKVDIIKDINSMSKGELAFFLSCENIIPKKYLRFHRHNLVVHESDLPKGKGWSPVTWQVLEGRNRIPVCLFEAVEKVDSGRIYLKGEISLDGSELNSEIKHKQGLVTGELIHEFVDRYPDIKGCEQTGEETFYPRRNPSDSELNINKTIEEQFNLLRVVDNDRYPAFFYRNGHKYIIRISKEQL